MSFVDPSQNPNQDDENQSQVDVAQNGGQQTQNQQSQSDQSSATPPATSGGGGSGIVSGGSVGGAAGAAPGATGGPTKPSSSGSWTNLNSYLSANQDQGAGIGTKIANTINSQGQGAEDEINNLNSGFNQAVQGNTVAEDSTAVNQAVNDASALQFGQNLSQADLDAFKRQANASYSGPTDLTQSVGYSQAAGDASRAQTAAAQSATEAGRDVLLQNQFSNTSPNGYTQGENNLDQLLLEGSGGGQAINQAANQWTGLSGALNSDVSTSNAAAAAAQAETAKTAADALSTFNTGRTAADTSVQNYLSNQQANYSNDYNALVNSLNNYSASGGGNLSLSAQQAQLLNLQQNQRLYDLYQSSPQLGSQYLNQAAFNAAEEITPEQQAELAALDQLGATANQTATNPYTNAALAGTQNADNSIDTSGFQQAVANANQAFTDTAAKDISSTGSGSQAIGYSMPVPDFAQTPFGPVPTGTFHNQFVQTGTTNATGYGDESLANYISRGQGLGAVNLGTTTQDQQGFTPGAATNPIVAIGGGGAPGSNENSADSTAQNIANQQAQQNLWNELQNAIKTSGYNNQVNIT